MPALAAIATLATAATIAAALTAALAAHRSLATAPLPPLLSPHMPSSPDACRCRAPTPSSFSGRLPSGWTFLGRAQPAAVKTTAKTAAVSAAALPIAAETAALPAAVSAAALPIAGGRALLASKVKLKSGFSPEKMLYAPGLVAEPRYLAAKISGEELSPLKSSMNTSCPSRSPRAGASL